MPSTKYLHFTCQILQISQLKPAFSFLKGLNIQAPSTQHKQANVIRPVSLGIQKGGGGAAFEGREEEKSSLVFCLKANYTP